MQTEGQDRALRILYKPWCATIAVDSSFKLRAGAALAVSVAADALDYVAAPLFAIPVLGDIPDAMITSILFAITRSKRSTLLNMIEFVPVIGDFVPIYTLTTLLWIYQESRKKKKATLQLSSSLAGSFRRSSFRGLDSGRLHFR